MRGHETMKYEPQMQFIERINFCALQTYQNPTNGWALKINRDQTNAFDPNRQTWRFGKSESTV